MTQLYSIREERTDYLVSKFDKLLNHEHTYAVSKDGKGCDGEHCAHRPSCKHRKLLPLFKQAGHISDGWMLDWDTRAWQRPEGDIAAAAAETKELEAAKQAMKTGWHKPEVEEIPVPPPPTPAASSPAGSGGSPKVPEFGAFSVPGEPQPKKMFKFGKFT